MRRVSLAVVIAVALSVAPTAAQKTSQKSSSSKIRPGDSSNAVGNEIGEKPEAVLKMVKVKGKLSAIDLKERTITVAGKEKEDELKLNFSQPTGREQIKVSKKAEKTLGKKRLKLEELKVGTEVSFEYYPALGQLLELVVEQPAS